VLAHAAIANIVNGDPGTARCLDAVLSNASAPRRHRVMFYFLSKLLDVFLTPLTWAIVCGLAAIPYRRGQQMNRRRKGLALAAPIILLVFSQASVSSCLFHQLEAGAPKTAKPDVTYDVVILLGGVVDERTSLVTGSASYNDNSERLTGVFELLRDGRAKNVLISSAGAPGLPEDAGEVRVLARALEHWGIDKSRIVLEDRSLNTYENALYSKKIVQERGWSSVLVVTSAFHMKRALGCFRKVGLAVDAFPVDYRTPAALPELLSLPRTEALQRSSAALREATGRVVYRLRGYAE
jgi:uncharacterized SAM-binding protein YcdF (DUF218 family)